MTDGASAESLLGHILTKQEGERLIENPSEFARFGRLLGSRVNVEAIFADFKTQFYKLKFVSLKLAFEPRREFLAQVKKWFEYNLEGPVVIDLAVDPSIIGGAVIIANDHYKDFSIAKRFDFLLLASKRHQI